MLLLSAVIGLVAAGVAGLTRTGSALQRHDQPESSWRPAVPARAWKNIVLHHSATASGTVEGIDREHRQRKDAAGQPWQGIGYHFVIGNSQGMADGLVQPTFRW